MFHDSSTDSVDISTYTAAPTDTYWSLTNPTPATPVASGSWWSTDIAPVLTTAIQTAGTVAKAALTPVSPYGTTPLNLATMTPAQLAKYQASLSAASAASNPLTALTSSMTGMMPYLMIGGGVFLLLMFMSPKKG